MARTGERFVFGPFELDIDNSELRRDGIPLKLTPQPFTALHLLVSHAGTLVTRDELRRALWGDDSFVDFNASLNFCIGQVRAALTDPVSQSNYLVTVPRRGYKLVCKVQRVAPDAPVMTAPALTRNRATWSSTGFLRVAATVIVMTAIAAAVAGWRQPSISPSAPRMPVARPLGAIAHYERGISGLADASPGELMDRVRYFESAIAADPTYAEAYAGLADAKLILGNYRAEPPQIAYAGAKAAGAKALSLDEHLGEAHAVYAAALLYFDWDWVSAGQHFERAVSLSPESARVHQWYSRYLSGMSRHRDAVRHASVATTLAPGSPSARTDLGMAMFYAGRLLESAAACHEAAALMKEFVPAHMCAASATEEAGAIDSSTDNRDPSGSKHPKSFWLARLDSLQANVTDRSQSLSAVDIAAALEHAGDRERALAWLERAANYRTDSLIFAGVHPAFASLRSNPRFKRVLQRVGL